MSTLRTVFLASRLLAGSSLLGACSQPQDSATRTFVEPTELTAVSTPPPDYPLQLACDGVGGTTTLSVTVGIEGKPTQVSLVQGSGSETLDQIALEQVKTWQFRAATRNGQPIAKTIQVPMSFNPPQPRPERCFGLDAGRKVN